MSDNEESPMVGTEPGEEPVVEHDDGNVVVEEAVSVVDEGARLFLGNLPASVSYFLVFSFSVFSVLFSITCFAVYVFLLF
jgi:hypothetical protein